MKVLKIIHTLGHGGAENTFRWLAWGLQQKGAEVIAAIPSVKSSNEENWLAQALRDTNISFVSYDATGSPWQMLKNLTAVIGFTRPDIVHSHLLDSNFYSSLACRYRNIPHVCTEHGDVALNRTALTRLKYTSISLFSQRVVCVSEAVRKNAIQVIPARWKLTSIYNGIRFMETRTTSFRNELGISDSMILIGNVGNLYPVKGQKYLIMAFAEICKLFPEAILVLVGRGAEEYLLKKLAEELKIPPGRVLFTGFRNDIENVLNSLNLYIQPSLSEGHPLSVLEAMSLGVPVIASAVGGIPEIIQKQKFGTLVKAGNVEELRGCIEKSLTDPEIFSRKAIFAKTHVRKEYSIERMAERYLNCYQDILN